MADDGMLDTSLASEMAAKALEQVKKEQGVEVVDEEFKDDSVEESESVTEETNPFEVDDNEPEGDVESGEQEDEEATDDKGSVDQDGDEDKLITPEDIKSMQSDDLWADLSKLRTEGKLDDASKKMLSAFESVFHRTIKKKDDKYKAKLEEQVEELQRQISESRNQQNEFQTQQRKQQEDHAMRQQLEDMAPEEREMFELKMQVKELTGLVQNQAKQITTQQTNAFVKDVKRDIASAVSKMGDIDEDLAPIVEEEALTEALSLWSKTGKLTPVEEVVRSTAEKYDRLFSDERLEKLLTGKKSTVLNRLNKKFLEEVSKKKSKGGKAIPSTPTGGKLTKPDKKEDKRIAVTDMDDYRKEMSKMIREEYKSQKKEQGGL